MTKMKSFGLACLGLIWTLGFWGCAAPSIYTIDMMYDPYYAEAPATLKPDARALQSIITVAEFTDVRSLDDPLVIGRVLEKDGMKVLVLPKTIRPTAAAAEGIRQYLRKAGYNVSAVADPWNLQEATIPQSPVSKIMIGGALEDIAVDCRRAFPTNTYTTKIRMTLYLADMTERKILHRVTVEATNTLEHVFFSPDRMGNQAGVALGDAIEKIFEKQELAQALSEVLKR